MATDVAVGREAEKAVNQCNKGTLPRPASWSTTQVLRVRSGGNRARKKEGGRAGHQGCVEDIVAEGCELRWRSVVEASNGKPANASRSAGMISDGGHRESGFEKVFGLLARIMVVTVVRLHRRKARSMVKSEAPGRCEKKWETGRRYDAPKQLRSPKTMPTTPGT